MFSHLKSINPSKCFSSFFYTLKILNYTDVFNDITEALKDAQGKTCIIVVENHTIVKFSDLKKCSQLNSWGACMPYGEGYIQMGDSRVLTN